MWCSACSEIKSGVSVPVKFRDGRIFCTFCDQLIEPLKAFRHCCQTPMKDPAVREEGDGTHTWKTVCNGCNEVLFEVFYC